MIDSGYPAESRDLLAGLARLSLTPADIDLLALTHIHVDHAGGAGHLAALNPHLEILVHANGRKHMADPSRLVASVQKAYGDKFSMVGAMNPIAPERIRTVGSGSRIDLGDVELQVYDAPGHARHHVLYFDAGTRTIFCGDALGSRYPGLPSFVLTPPPDYDKFLAQATIDFIQRELAPQRICFTHCGAYPADELGNFYAPLKQQHDRWTECIHEIIETQPDLPPTDVFQQFLDKLPSLKNYPSQYFSFNLSVNGIVTYLKKSRNPEP